MFFLMGGNGKHHSMGKLMDNMCNGQRIIKVSMEGRKITVHVAGKEISCSDLIPKVTSLIRIRVHSSPGGHIENLPWPVAKSRYG